MNAIINFLRSVPAGLRFFVLVAVAVGGFILFGHGWDEGKTELAVIGGLILLFVAWVIYGLISSKAQL